MLGAYCIDGRVVMIQQQLIVSMINRLVAESTVKVAFRGDPRFSTSKRLLAFQAQGQLRVKCLSREAKDIEVPFNNPPKQAVLSQAHSWLYQLTPAGLLQVHHLEYLNGIAEGSSRKIAILHHVEDFREVEGGLVIVAADRTLKTISFKEMAVQTEINLNIDARTLPALTHLPPDALLTTSPTSSRILVTKPTGQSQTVTQVFDRVGGSSRYQLARRLTYLSGVVLALYQDRFAFQRSLEKEVEIYDIEESKLVGRVTVEGSIKFAELNNNLLLLVTAREQTDYCHFFILNAGNNGPVVTHRALYEKGRGDFYQLSNLLTAEANILLDKKKGTDFPDGRIARVGDNTSSILYVLNKAKEKVEIIKLDHSKVLKSAFNEEPIDQPVYSNQALLNGPSTTSTSPTSPPESEKARVQATLQARVGEKSVQELQRQLVESLIDIKLRGVLQRFEKLQRRVQSLQRLIGGISQKVETSLARINREEIKLNVQKLFDSLTPQFQRYFKEIFQQVAGVLQQGVGYYNLKLAKQAEMHKEALAQIVTETFKATEDIVHIGRREQGINERTEEHLRKILDSKRRWTKSTEDYEARLREVPTPNLREGKEAKEGREPREGREGRQGRQGRQGKEGKVFVRADLNYPQGRRET